MSKNRQNRYMPLIILYPLIFLLSTDYHRLTQIIIFGTEIHGFFKDTAWLRIDIIHGTS